MPTEPLAFEVPHQGTLRDLLRGTPRLPPERTVALLSALGRALAAWQARAAASGAPGRAAHGAVAPERVLVGPDDTVTLGPPPPRADGAPAPWPTYLAPEQIDGHLGDPRSDIYALGLVGWEMLAGRQPWEGESLYGLVVKQREQDLPRLSTLRPGLPRALVHAIEGCLHKAPSDRWQTVDEFLAALAPADASPATVRAPVTSVLAVPAVDDVPRAVRPPGAARDAVSDRRPTPRPGAPPSAPPSAPPGRRWLAGAVLAVALLSAGAAALVVVRGKNDSRDARAWLDSVTAQPAGGELPAAGAAQTTTVNTTSVPVRRTGAGARARPIDTLPDTVLEVEPVEPPEEPVLEPTPPFVARPGGVLRPTVPPPTVPRLRRDSGARPAPDTSAFPDSLARR